MPRNYWIPLVIFVLVVALGLTYLQSQPVVPEDTLKIGATEALTGNAAYYGELTKRGIDVAEAELREKYPGLSLEIYHQDSFYTAKGGVDAYQNLRATQAIDAVITHGSPIALAVKPLAAADGILQMAVSSSVSGYSSPNDLSFRTSATTNYEVIPMVQFIQSQGYERIALLAYRNDFGASTITSLKSELARTAPGVEIVFEEDYLIDSSDFRVQLSKIKQAEAQALFFIGLTSNTINLLAQKEELGVTVQMLGTRVTEDPSLITNAGVRAEGMVYTYNFDAENNMSLVRDFVAAFERHHGQMPDAFAAEGYLGTKLVGEAFIKCGKDYTCMQEYLTSLRNHESIFGDISFDENGDITYDFFLKTIQDGKFVKRID